MLYHCKQYASWKILFRYKYVVAIKFLALNLRFSLRFFIYVFGILFRLLTSFDIQWKLGFD